MMRAFFTLRSAAALMVLAGASGFAAEQQTLQHVKDLYARAAYEDALGALSNLAGTEPVTEAASYRAACLLALGRGEDARKVVGEVVLGHPEYRPDPAETSPRVLELFRAARRVRVPEAARGMYAEAKAAMDRQDADVAIGRFEALIRLIDDPEFAGDEALSELKILADGFLELTRAKAAAAKPETPPAPTPAAVTPAAVTRPAITPAVPIEQQLPTWLPPAGLAQWEFAGAVRVNIGADGKVISAAIEKPVHTAYDAALLAAARGWRYQPALLNGLPVASERVVQVVLRPR